MKSWYHATELSVKQLKYLLLIQKIWNVKNASDVWVPYKLTPHQIHWHSNDVACLGADAKNRVVVKSRNTSFTVSSIISCLMDVPNRSKQIVPFVRLNKERAIDLLEEVKEHIRHMNPVKLKDGSLYPFDPSKVYMEKAMSITFPNGTEFRAMPSNAASAEIIRGMRIVGSAGILDEVNFMAGFQKIYIALRDASRGSVDGKKIFQMNIGTTRKGRMTNFNMWFEDILRNKPDNIMIFEWPVLNNPELDVNYSLLEQAEKLDLTPIVDWHDLKDLENKRKENLNTFLEEYMAILVDAEEQLYKYSIVEASISEELSNTEPEEGVVYSIGIDPAATNHLFAISIFDRDSKEQKYLYYERGTPLKTMEKFCENIIKKWKPWRVVIDGNGLGYQLAQSLRNKFGGSIIKVIRGAMVIKTPGKRTGNIPMTEFIHTNMIKMMNYNEIKLIPDEYQTRHYMMWRNDYKCDEDPKFGHGDIVVANGYALLPENWKITKDEVVAFREKEAKQPILDVSLEKVEDIEWGEE